MKKKREKRKNARNAHACSLFNIQSPADTKSKRHEAETPGYGGDREQEREKLYIVWEAGSRVKGEAINRLTSLRATSALYSAVRTGPRIY